MKPIQELLPSIVRVECELLELDEPFGQMAARFAHQQGCAVLLSGGDLDCAGHHILAMDPWMTIVGRPGASTLAVDDETVDGHQPPLDRLQRVLDHCRLDLDDGLGPIAAGLFGYLAYDLKDDLEVLPRTTVDDLHLPTLYFAAPSLIVVQEVTSGQTRMLAPVRSDRGVALARARMKAFKEELGSATPAETRPSDAVGSLVSNVSRRDHMDAVQQIIDYIAAGDIYQANLAQRFEMDFDGDAYLLFQKLFEMNPAPFFAYVNAGDHQIVSTSPERFLLRDKQRVETRPIKGTRPRGETPEQDRVMKAELAASEKDDAELSMIVDLLRNDIGKVCAGGSVRVAGHKRVEAYQNVYHLVSVVEGELAAGKDSVDLIKAAFPGGSITGCPKIRAMEIIDELESVRRHVYTGSIGYISFHDTMDLSIAIRTATLAGGRLVFSVGGGVVYDSDPADEYEETLHKGRTLMTAIQGSDFETEAVDDAPLVWFNGRIQPQSKAAVPVSDMGLQYGFGFFETMRVERGNICRLDKHLARFNRSWRALFNNHPPDLTWKAVIDQVIAANGLADTSAAVKILATRGDDPDRVNGAMMVSARPYVHRLNTLGTKGVKLATYPHPRTTPLANHKSLNYLYYYQASGWAQARGAHEALIINGDGSVSETNTASILVVMGKTVIRPQSEHVLPGVMQAEICRRLEKMGFIIQDRRMKPKELYTADAVLLTNALMGVVATLALDGKPLKTDFELVDRLTEGLLHPTEASHAL